MSQESNKNLTPLLFKVPNTDVILEIVLLPQWKKEKGSGNWVEQEPVPYMKVPQRLVWFNIEKPDWIIETSLVEIKEGFVQANCIIKNPEGKIMRTAHKTLKYEGEKDWDAVETGAIGRALAMLGYGTQYASNELEESNEQPVDAPTTTLKKESQVKEKVNQIKEISSVTDLQDPGEYVIQVGVDTGKTIKKLWEQNRLRGRIDFLKGQPKRSEGSQKLLEMGEAYLKLHPQEATDKN